MTCHIRKGRSSNMSTACSGSMKDSASSKRGSRRSQLPRGPWSPEGAQGRGWARRQGWWLPTTSRLVKRQPVKYNCISIIFGGRFCITCLFELFCFFTLLKCMSFCRFTRWGLQTTKAYSRMGRTRGVPGVCQ